MNSNSTESDQQDDDPHVTTITTTTQTPSGLSNLFNNNNRPLNAFIITSKPPLLNTRSTGSIQQTVDMSPSSFSRSSAYFTASLPNSIIVDGWEQEESTPSSSNHYLLSRTLSSSSNYFDNQSDYEVILDDGSKQKRTISLSTIIQPTSSFSQQPKSTTFLENWIYSSSSKAATTKNNNNNRNYRNDSSSSSSNKETTRLLSNNRTHDRKLKNDNNNKHMPLFLSSSSSDSEKDDDKHVLKSTRQRKNYYLSKTYKKWLRFRDQYLTLNHNQKMVLKCSFAYMIGSLFTFVPALNSLCGTHIASHMAATVTVFFHPAKSIGGMVEAAGFGWLYTLAALTLSLASMYTTDYFLEHDMSTVAYAIALGVWLAGSTFIISYLKAKINTPSILTASGLAFIILFTVIVRQGSGNEVEFNFDIITETFAIVAIGTIISVSVCVLIWPMSASKKLRTNIDASLSSTKVLLKLLTKTFLLDADLPEFTANKTLETALKSHRTSFTALKPALKQAKLEFYNLEMTHHANGYKKIVESMERLAQHVGGLKSSCGLQVEVMQQSSFSVKDDYGTIVSPTTTTTIKETLGGETFNLKAGPQRKRMESELKREKKKENNNRQQQQQQQQEEIASSSSYFDIIISNTIVQEEPSINKIENDKRKEGALVQFIRTVRSPMKSLAYTCKQTIIHLQARIMHKTTQTTPSFELMRQNLTHAIELFESSQHQALLKFYKRRFKKHQKDIKTTDNLHSLFLTPHFPAEDVFLVYFFVFCLLEFAKELMTLVKCVQSVYEADHTKSIFSWTKYLFRKRKVQRLNERKEKNTNEDIFVPNNHNTLNTLHTPAPKTKVRKFLLKLWGFFSEFRTYRVRFALKAMLTAELISILAFIPVTRPYFTALKMEWTLITVMAVMMPTVGGTYLGAVLRVIATIFGCIVAAIVYTIFHDNTVMLVFLTWLISIPSFWMILHHKHGRFGLFTLLAYNLIVLFKFNNRDDENIDVFDLSWMRCVAVSLGVVIGLIVTAYVWPYEARTEVRKGLSDLLLRLSWLYKQLVSVYSEEDYYDNSVTVTSKSNLLLHEQPMIDLSMLTRRNKIRAAGLQKIELSIQVGIFYLEGLLVHAPNEPRLKGPFPVKTYTAMITCCQNILDKLLSLRIVILKDVWAVYVRRNFLIPASQEFMEMAGNVFLYFYLLASALQLKTPLPPYLPPAEKTRQLLMQKLQQLPLAMEESIQQLNLSEEKKDECYMVYYAYVVLMENIIRELDLLGGHMKDLFGTLVPDDQWARCFGQQRDLEHNN